MTSSQPPSYSPQGYSQYSVPQYQPPRKKRGLKRIIFGILGIIANAIGLFVMPFVAAMILALVAVMGATPETLGGASGSFDATTTKVYYVYVPTSEQGSVSCSVEGGTLDTESSTVPATIEGTEYTAVGSVQVESDQKVSVSCDGASDVAVASIGVMGTIIGFVVGLVIPIGLGLIAIALLIWGIIARVRS